MFPFSDVYHLRHLCSTYEVDVSDIAPEPFPSTAG